jgi:hypothetical protein
VHIPYLRVHIDQLLACHVRDTTEAEDGVSTPALSDRAPLQIHRLLADALVDCCAQKTLQLARMFLAAFDDDNEQVNPDDAAVDEAHTVAMFTHLIDETTVAQMHINSCM